MDKIIIIGSSGHAKVVIDIVECENRYKITGILDRCRNVGEQTLGYKVLGQEEDLPGLIVKHNLKGAIVAIGDNFVREKVVAHVHEICPRLPFVNSTHPNASIAKSSSVGEGSVIMSGVVVNPACLIGRFCILNTNSSLDHDSVMEDFSSLAPSATTGGNCRIGACSAISIGAVLIHDIQVGEHTVIGAASTVLENIQPYSVAYGTPTVVVRERAAGEKYL